MREFIIEPTALVKRDHKRRIDIKGAVGRPTEFRLDLLENGAPIASENFALSGSFDENHPATVSVWLNLPERDLDASFRISDRDGNIVSETLLKLKKPREWKLFIMVSSHTDIGLHNSQYIQRYNSSRFVDMAAKLCDATSERSGDNQYRYVMEGSWFFSNYAADRGDRVARKIIDDYIKSGKLGVCAGVAGNHTQTYNHEEICRSAYSIRYLRERGVDTHTMSMIDNNGISPAIIQPYADAGIENIIFAPNQWNPIPSEIWKCDRRIPAFTWNPNAGGGGSRIDVRYSSELPMLFRWRGAGERELLVWASTSYSHGGDQFGLLANGNQIGVVEDMMADQLSILEAKYPYDIWLLASYTDDQEPNLRLCDTIAAWNKEFLYPTLRIVGNPDEPFELVRKSFYDELPVLSGDITGGWYQHPLSAAELLADKSEAARRLETAEKSASLAALKTGYTYPESEFNRAYAGLVMNDEHSYGTSGYQGRRVYETWAGHRDWIEYARKVADTETKAALKAIADETSGDGERVIVFNSTAKARRELVISDFGKCVADLVPFGWTTLPIEKFAGNNPDVFNSELPPKIENDFYRVVFAKNGSIAAIFDKELGKTLNSDNVNELIYTKDNHKTFHSPEEARFITERDEFGIKVTATADDAFTGARIITEVTLPAYEKRIDIDDHIEHFSDMFNTDRYKRYAYIGFGFDLPECRRYCDLGGIEGEYGVSVTGHGTDVYMAAREYVAVDSDEGYGVGLIQLDSELVEFDHIHPDKTDFGNPGDGSAIYSYIANDWLQMHVSGGDELNYQFRYTITSYNRDHAAAGLSELAERAANPVLATTAKKSGNLPASESFISSSERLISVKKAYGSDRLSVRFLTDKTLNRDETVKIMSTSLGKARLTATDESEYAGSDKLTGYLTFAIDGEKLNTRPETVRDELEIGSGCEGLLNSPRAVHGEERGMLYLLWGKCRAEVAFYELFRSEESGFLPDETNKLAIVEPEEYVVGRFVDRGLSYRKRYYYRVRAVAGDGRRGKVSEEFSGRTS